MIELLTKAEIQELTGYKLRNYQANALGQAGVPFMVMPNGDLKVLRAVAIEKMGGLESPEPKRVGINLEALSTP